MTATSFTGDRRVPSEEMSFFSEGYRGDPWNSSPENASPRSESTSALMSTPKNINSTYTDVDQQNMDPTSSENDIMSKLLLILETELSIKDKVEHGLPQDYNMDVRIGLDGEHCLSSTPENGTTLLFKDNLVVQTTPKCQYVDDQIDQQKPSPNSVLEDSSPCYFRGNLDPQLGWQGYRVQSLLDDTARDPDLEVITTTWDKTEAADKKPKQHRQALNMAIEHFQKYPKQYAIQMNPKEQEERRNAEGELERQEEASQVDTGFRQDSCELSLDDVDLIQVPKDGIDEEHEDIFEKIVDEGQKGTNRTNVIGENGWRGQRVARLPNPANHRELVDALPEPHQPHPSSKIPPTPYQETFRTRQNNIDKPNSEACPCKRNYLRLGDDQAHRIEHADEAMARSSPRETKHPSTLDLSYVLTDNWGEGQRAEIPAEDIPVTTATRSLKSNSEKTLKRKSVHAGDPQSPREEQRKRALEEPLEPRKRIKSLDPTKEQVTASWYAGEITDLERLLNAQPVVAQQRYLDPDQNSLLNYDRPVLKSGASLGTMAPGFGEIRPINRLKPPNHPFTSPVLKTKPTISRFPRTAEQPKAAGYSSKRQKIDAQGLSSGSPTNMDETSSNQESRRLSSTAQSRQSQSQSGFGRDANGMMGPSATVTIDKMMDPVQKNPRRSRKVPKPESQVSLGHGSSKFRKHKEPSEIVGDDNDPIAEDDVEEINTVQSRSKAVSTGQYPVVEILSCERPSAICYKGSANREPAQPNAKGTVSCVTMSNTKITPIVLSHFSHSYDRSRSRTQHAGETGTKPARSQTVAEYSDDSIDEITLEKSPLDGSNAHVANNLLNKLVTYGPLARNTKGKPLKEQIPLHEYSDDELSRYTADKIPADITPSVFKSTSRSTLLKGEKEFTAIQFFSESRRWLVSGRQSPWTLRSSAGGLTFRDEHSNLVQTLSFNVSKLTEIKWCEDSAKLVLSKSRDEFAKGASLLCLELIDAAQSCKFVQMASRPLLKITQSTPVDLDRTFENKLKTLLRQVVDDDELSLLEKRSESKEERRKASETKKSGSQRLVDRMQIGSEDTVNHPNNITRRVTGNQNAAYDIRPHSRYSSVEIVPEDFYQPLDKSLHVTRSSARAHVGKVKKQPPRPRSPSPALEEWTEDHPGWQKKWYSSIIYPTEGKNKATVDMQDIKRLNEGEFLNDNLIIFYLRYLEHRLEQTNPELAKRFYFFNTFFYSKLTTPGKGSRGINYEAVKRWTNKMPLLEYDYIIVPVNENTHWYVAIICNAPKLLPFSNETVQPEESDVIMIDHAVEVTHSSPGDQSLTELRKMSLEDECTELGAPDDGVSNPQSKDLSKECDIATLGPLPIVSDISDQNSKQLPKKTRRKSVPVKKYDPRDPRIITLDSLGSQHITTCTNLKKYLIKEIQERKGLEIDDPGSIGMTATGLPPQNNYCDCGLFLLSYIETLLDHPKLIDSLLQHEKVDKNLFPLAPDMRKSIRDLLFQLQDQQHAIEVAKPPKFKRNRAAKSSAKVQSSAGSRPPFREAAGETRSPPERTRSEDSTTEQEQPFMESYSGEISEEQSEAHPPPLKLNREALVQRTPWVIKDANKEPSVNDRMLLDRSSSPFSGSVQDADPPLLGAAYKDEHNMSLPVQQFHIAKLQIATHVDLTEESL